MIVIIDYDMGNPGSIKNMLHHIGHDDVLISGECTDIVNAEKLILPGVGAFDQGMKNLADRRLDAAIRKAVTDQGKPLLGICLGMQLLGRSSEEGNLDGLGLIPFKCVRFKPDIGYKIPHMGWDEIAVKSDTGLTCGMDEEPQRFYFVHSYHAVCENDANILMTCSYGYEFTAAVYYDNIYGVQFHPEKSHRYGMKLFENFVRI